MEDNYSYRHLEVDRNGFHQTDRVIERQQALVRYRHLKNLNESQLTLDDELFIENFETALHLWWGYRKVDSFTSVECVAD